MQKYNLETVFGTKNKIKLLRFLVGAEDWQFNLNEISKEIKINKGALSRLIRELEKKNILIVKRKGKLLLFKLNDQNIKDALSKLFDIERKLK